MIVCIYCGHFREQHFRTDEHGHEDQQPCVESYGSGRYACWCTEWQPAPVRVHA